MLNQKQAGPLRHRLSELSEVPGSAAHAGALPGVDIALRAAALLGNLPRPAQLSAAAEARIGERLALASLPRPWWQGTAAVTAAAATLGALAGAVALIPRLVRPLFHPDPGQVVRELRLPAGDRAADRGETAATPVVTALAAPPEPTKAVPEPAVGLGRPRPTPRPVKLSPLAAPVPSASASAGAALGLSAGGSAPADALGGPSGLAAESRLLGVVLHQLHQDRDGAAALRSLDSYEQRFPSGLLIEEAQAARIDALLLLDHPSEALKLLDRTHFQRLGRGGELRVVRAELRSTAGRYREALTDFAQVLASTAVPPPVAERALYGQASCLTELADTQGARAALEQYLARFPKGRFADAARRSLLQSP